MIGFQICLLMEVPDFWPLLINTGAGAKNGSLAWILFGSFNQDTVNFDSIPASAQTYNASGWLDINNNWNSTYTSIASVLYCDPQLEYVTMTPTLYQRNITVETSEKPRWSTYNATLAADPVGNLDRDEVSRMFNRALNGILRDSVPPDPLTTIPSFLKIPRVATELLYRVPDSDHTYRVQDIANITASLNNLMSSVAANAYLDGFLGTVNVEALSLEPIERLQVSWLQWWLTLGLVCATLVLSIPASVSGKSTVPLTIEAVARVMDEEGLLEKDSK